MQGMSVRVCSTYFCVAILISLLPAAIFAVPPQGPPAQTSGPRIWLGERQQLPIQTPSASRVRAALLTQAQSTAAAQPLSLLTGDVNEDGVPDLLVGYSGYVSIQPGNLDAFAPQSDQSFQAIAHGQFPAPFLPQALQIATPVNPDFLAVGHFTASGHNDLVIAAKGGTALYVFAGDGSGNFAPPQRLNLPGGVTVMAGGDLGHASGFNQIIAGLSAPSGPELAIFSGSKDGLNAVAAFPLGGPASNLNFGDFGDGGTDLAFLAGGKVEILRASTMQLQPVSLPISAVALAVGNFVIDRVPGLQLALLTADGSIHIAAHSEFDPRAYSADELIAIRQSARLRSEANSLLPAKSFPVNGWKIVEDINAATSFSAGQPPVMFRTRISDHQMDDLMVLNGLTGLLTVVQHPDPQPGQIGFAPAVLSTRPYSGTPVAAIPQRINVDGRAGVLAIHQGESAPSMLMPLPDPTFVVNRTDDPVPVSPITNACNGVANDCSLREAILRANATAGTDTINVPAGTYTLTLPRVAGDFSGQHGTLEVTDSVNIVGAGQNTTIIQGGALADLSDSVDKVFSFNQDIAAFTNATVSVSNLTIQHGRNRGDCCARQDGFGGAFDFDTGSPGTATLTLTNVTLQNNAIFDGQGGAFTMFNTLNGAGFATLSNVIVQNNDATANATGCCGDGGGGVIDARSHIVMSNVQVLNNHTHANAGTNPTGGGLFFSGQHTQPQSHISAGSISGNTAAGIGGGINSIATLLIDGGTVISNNSSGTDANFAGGGGIRNDAFDGLTLSKVTITGNTTSGNGGGIYTGDGSGIGTVTINFSRLAGNTSTHNAGSNNLFNVTATSPGNIGNPVTATNDWWGTNVPSGVISQNGSAAGSTCPVASPSSAVCFDPFIVLTHQANPAKIRINQSTTLTADMSKDNHGNGAALVGNLDRIVGLPITFDTPVLGTIPQAQPETLNASAVATATFNAGNTSGRGSAHATVDQGVASANVSLIASATEAGTTVTITTVGAHGFSTGETAVISGVGVGGYNGTFIITATPTVNTFTYTDATSALGASSGGTANVGIVILEPPQITKSFGAATIPVNGTTTVSFSINNPNVVAINSSFTDTLPVGLQVAATPGVTNTCGGTVTAVAGSGSISFSNNLLPVGICTISVNITGTVDNNYTNSVQVLSTDAGNGNTSSANLTVINPPSISKAFGAVTIPLNGVSSLTFTLSSSNQNLTINGAAFTDSLPAGLIVATPPSVGGTCTGTVTATAGASSVSLSGQTLAPSASCTVSVNVQGTTAGVKNNSVQATSTNAGTGNTSNASITVVGPPLITKKFGAPSIPLNGSTSLSFTITNPNTTVALSSVAFSDTLPAGLVISTPNGLTGVCSGGTITATQGTGVISLSGASIAASSSCTFSVNVTGTAAGVQANTTGNVTSLEGGTGGTASDSVTVEAPPSIAKVFNPSTIALNATTSLTFTITNPAANVDALTGVGFIDTLPTGLTVANASATVCGGTLTTTAPTGIALSGATINSNSQCQFSVTVTGAASGQYTNTTGNVTSTNGGTGNTASANLTVATPPSIQKAFGAATIPVNGTTTLTFTIQNPNAGLALTGITFSDTLPAGLVVASTPNLSNTCGGTATAVGGSGSVSLSAGTLAASASCTLSVNVQGKTAGVKNNSVQVSSTEGGTGNTSNASITVVAAPAISKVFGATSIPLNGSTSLSFTIQNGNTTTALTGVAFSDTLPAGLVISTPSGITGSCGSGTITATQGTNVISLSGGTIAASSSCTFAVNVTGTSAGTQINTTGNVTSTEGGTGGSATASVNVEAPPSIAKVFNPSAIAQGDTTSLTFTITNPAGNVDGLTGVAFTDTLPTGLTVANATATVCGGTLTTTAPTGIALSGATIAANSQCQFSVTVTGTAAGQYTNTTGNVTSTNGGTGNTASANLTVKVEAPPSIAKVFNPSAIALNGTTSLTFTITNPAANIAALTGVAFTDTLPTGLTVANATATVCGGTLTTIAPTGISLSGATIAINGQCQFSVTVTGAASGLYTNTTGNVTSTNGGTGNTASANLTVATPPSIQKAFGAATIPLNGITSLTFTITNPNTNLALTGITFTDNLPAGLVVGPTPSLNNTCGGTATAVGGSGSVSLSAGTLAAGASCTLSVNVQGKTAGVKNNSVQVSSTEGGTGNTANASITVIATPVITKAFGAGSIPLNGSTSLSFTIQNSNTTTALTGVAFSDTLPAGLVISTPSGITGSCGSGTITATQGTNGISLSGGTIAASGSCAFSVNVTGIAAGTQINTTSNVSSNEGGTGGPATASINVVAPPTIAKVFNPANIALNATTSLTFTITNPAANTVALTGVAFTDTLPTGLTLANATATVCGGTLTTTAPTGIALSGATVAVNSQCQFSVTVTGAAAGQYTNTTGNVTSTNGGTGNTASANLSVATAPTITKAFGAASILLNASTSLTFNINNPNTTLALSGVAFTDALPSGLVVATPSGLTSSCGGTASAAAGSTSISLSGGALAAHGSCSISMNVTGVAAGVQNNTTSPISSTESGAGAPSNTASITVIAPPSIAKAFGAASINLNAATTLTFTITNPNATVALTGVAFSDTLPAGLVVASPNGLTGSCGSGTITTSASSVNLSVGTIAAGGSCTFSVNVVGTTAGHKVNTTGTVSSTNAGSGNQATASIDVFAPDTAITKVHTGTFTRGQTGAQWVITVSNVGFGPTSGTVTVVDTLPNVVNPPVPTAISGTGWTCTLATLTCTRADALASGSSYPPITLTVNIPKNIQNTFTNTAKVSGGGDVNPNNNTATDKITLGPPIVLTPGSATVTISQGGTGQMVISVDAPDPTLGKISFTCSGLPNKSACDFSPASIDPAVTAGPTNVTVFVATARSSALLFAPRQSSGHGHAPMYAMLSLPVFGIMLAGFDDQRRKRAKRRAVLVLLGLVSLLAMTGCGTASSQPVPVVGTPTGAYAITVTATSTGATATASFNLVVQ
jgi:uncharacterized repeat protein (TIGR01451 family)/fimbrial isopeptide formation D2 family protein